ncbi:RNA polymerase II transcription factor B subunit 4 [Tulasnella sp. 330]|nr:RNA polymerase II transcription factor B subunit 4 [Tulasnella sp. 330]KAG8886135.1 RNA polymerase II transcription factor B subunit 4 [Tulasnella sp. 331]
MNATTTNFTDSTTDSLPSHLTLIIDLNPTQWHNSASVSPSSSNDAHQSLSISSFLAQVLILINAHLASRDDNTLAAIGAFPQTSEMIYTSSGGRGEGEDEDEMFEGVEDANSYRPFRVVDSALLDRVLKEMEKHAGGSDGSGRGSGGLVAAITKGLCHINKIMHTSTEVTTASDSVAVGPTVTTAVTSPKILILSVSPDSSTSYIPLMNSIFAAQKLKVKIDVCKIYGPDTVFLQQASYLTGGSYIHMERRDALLQYLMMCFLPPSSLSAILATPTQDKIEFRAACFCHKNIVDIGFYSANQSRTKFPMKNLQRLRGLALGTQPQQPTQVNGNGAGHLTNGSLSRSESLQLG